MILFKRETPYIYELKEVDNDFKIIDIKKGEVLKCHLNYSWNDKSNSWIDILDNSKLNHQTNKTSNFHIIIKNQKEETIFSGLVTKYSYDKTHKIRLFLELYSSKLNIPISTLSTNWASYNSFQYKDNYSGIDSWKRYFEYINKSSLNWKILIGDGIWSQWSKIDDWTYNSTNTKGVKTGAELIDKLIEEKVAVISTASDAFNLIIDDEVALTFRYNLDEFTNQNDILTDDGLWTSSIKDDSYNLYKLVFSSYGYFRTLIQNKGVEIICNRFWDMLTIPNGYTKDSNKVIKDIDWGTDSKLFKFSIKDIVNENEFKTYGIKNINWALVKDIKLSMNGNLDYIFMASISTLDKSIEGWLNKAEFFLVFKCLTKLMGVFYLGNDKVNKKIKYWLTDSKSGIGESIKPMELNVENDTLYSLVNSSLNIVVYKKVYFYNSKEKRGNFLTNILGYINEQGKIDFFFTNRLFANNVNDVSSRNISHSGISFDKIWVTSNGGVTSELKPLSLSGDYKYIELGKNDGIAQVLTTPQAYTNSGNWSYSHEFIFHNENPDKTKWTKVNQKSTGVYLIEKEYYNGSLKKTEYKFVGFSIDHVITEIKNKLKSIQTIPSKMKLKRIINPYTIHFSKSVNVLNDKISNVSQNGSITSIEITNKDPRPVITINDFKETLTDIIKNNTKQIKKLGNGN